MKERTMSLFWEQNQQTLMQSLVSIEKLNKEILITAALNIYHYSIGTNKIILVSQKNIQIGYRGNISSLISNLDISLLLYLHVLSTITFESKV